MCGNGGIVALFYEKRFVGSLADNVQELRSIGVDMQRQVKLAHTNNEYMRMNAHRVGLLSEDEYFIRLQYPLFTTFVSYSPGKIIQPRRSFYIPTYMLFFVALTIYCLFYSLQLIFLKKSVYDETSHYNMSPSDTLRSHASM